MGAHRVLLAPHITRVNGDELLAAAMDKPKSEVERLIAERLPQSDVPTVVKSVPALIRIPVTPELAPGPVETDVRASDCMESPVTGPESSAPARMTPIETAARVRPLAPQRFALQVTMSQELHDKLRYAQELLGHQVARDEVAAVLERALDALIPKLEQEFGATHRPRRSRTRTHDMSRKRDGGQCGFVNEKGQRCPATSKLEFDHVVEVARGGKSTVENVCLLCRAHNQLGAEKTFGAEFMRYKREEARRANTSGATCPT